MTPYCVPNPALGAEEETGVKDLFPPLQNWTNTDWKIIYVSFHYLSEL